MGMLVVAGGKYKNKKLRQDYSMWLAYVACASGDHNICVDTVSKWMIGQSLLQRVHIIGH
jgi:hypothetical protein